MVYAQTKQVTLHNKFLHVLIAFYCSVEKTDHSVGGEAVVQVAAVARGW